MKKIGGLGIAGIILGVIVLYGIYWYNSTVGMSEGVNNAWANVESSYQRRNDLIPNIVATAQKYAEFEQETLTAVIEARSNATSINVDASELTEENLAAFSKAQSQVSSGLGRLLATYENYPNLKANENFKELINELSRTENRINTERNRYNNAVGSYNVKVKKVPGVFFAGILGFEPAAFYQADEGAEVAPDVDALFDN
ncbi:LemA protein [Nonlabens dokdonensis]|jgi:LemA protein|uniref:LemA protein n=2 Tax=Nonlabens dokdonensis TaxID=328515 RepID=A0ABX5PW09_9FLAO|nr:LemA family protein [Nonlabens dokdonensis]AGC75246.1 putative LemA family protein [Nonlabens dokdonensis DSW-6]PZX39014.1 LemA protein [Nonlabens dokdonensis]